MRKQVFGRKLSRGRKSREALIRSELRAILSYGKIITTKAKAKAIQDEIDKLVNLARKTSVSGIRTSLSILGNDLKTLGIFSTRIGKLPKEKTSGFTRIINLKPRFGDKAEIVRLEFIEESKKDENIPAKRKRS